MRAAALTTTRQSERLGANSRGSRAALGPGNRILRFAIDLLAGLTDVDATLKIGALFDADALGDDVAGERTLTANVEAIAGRHIAANFTQNNDLPGSNIGRDDAVAADGDTVAGQVDGAFHAPIDVKRLRAGDFAFNDKRLTQGCLLLRIYGNAGGGTRYHRWFGSRRRVAALRFRARRRSGVGSIRRFPHVSKFLSEAWMCREALVVSHTATPELFLRNY